MTPASVLAGHFDRSIPFVTLHHSPDEILCKARAYSEYKDQTAELMWALMRRREILRIEKKGNSFVQRIETSLNNLTVPADLWARTGEVNINFLKWLLVRGANVAYSTWEQWGMAGGQRVRVLVDVVSELQNANNSFLHTENLGWLWGHLLHGVLEGDGKSAVVTNMSICSNSARYGQQPGCVCRSCLAFYVVEAGVVPEAEWCEVRQKECGYGRDPRPFTMLDALKMEYIVNNGHDNLLAHLLSRIPVQKREAVYDVANITATDPMILNYLSRGGVVTTISWVAQFVDSYIVFNKHRHEKWIASTKTQAPDCGAACTADLPRIRCGDLATTLIVIGELVKRWEAAKDAGETEAWDMVFWRMAVNTARFWLDVEVEKKKSVTVTINGQTTHVAVIFPSKTGETVLRKASAGEDAAVVKVVLQAMEEAGMPVPGDKATSEGK